MKSANLEISISPEIVVLPLKLNEKIILAHIAKNPKCTNAALAKILGVTERGAKKILQRLRSGGHVEQEGKGRARKLYLTFHVEQGTTFTNSNQTTPASKGEVRAHCSQTSDAGASTSVVSKTELSLEDDFEQTMHAIAQTTATMNFFPETVVRLLEPLIRRIETEMEDSPAKEEILRDLYSRHGAFLAICLAAKSPKEIRRELDQKISHATPGQLVQFRQCVQAGQLGHTTPLMLTAQFSDEVAR